MTENRPIDRIGDAIDLKGVVAVWVIGAHILTVLSPLLLLIAIYRNWDYVSEAADRPILFIVAVTLLMTSSGFEMAQNAFDRWYLTAETASADGHSFTDFLFYLFLILGLGMMALAARGDSWFVIGAVTVGILIYPFLYMHGGPYQISLSLLGLTSSVALFLAFDNPAVFLQMLCTAATIYSFRLLLRTGAQALHGFTAIANAVGIVVVASAIGNSAVGVPLSWLDVGLVTGGIFFLGLILWKPLSALAMTARPRS